MSILGGQPGGMDQAAERKAVLTLQGNQLGLLALANPQVGQCIEVCAELCIETISMPKDEAGVPSPYITFTVESVQPCEPSDDQTISQMYPSMADRGSS